MQLDNQYHKRLIIPVKFILCIFIVSAFMIQQSNKNLYPNSEQKNNKTSEIDCLKNYKVTISLDSYEYFVYQSLPLSIEFEYTGNKIDSLNLNLTNLSRNIIVKNSRSEVSNWAGESDHSNFTKFQPGDKRKFEFELNYHWGFARFDTPNLFGFYSYFPPDVYSVQIRINARELKSFSILKECNINEILSSNIIHFKIVEPTGINKAAFEMVKEIYKINIMGGKEINESIRLSNVFIQKFYNSVYIGPIFSSQSVRRSSRKLYDESSLEEAIIILNNHPDDIISRSAISQAFNYYKINFNEERALQFLEDAKVKYPNQEAGKWAEHELNRLRGN